MDSLKQTLLDNLEDFADSKSHSELLTVLEVFYCLRYDVSTRCDNGDTSEATRAMEKIYSAISTAQYDASSAEI